MGPHFSITCSKILFTMEAKVVFVLALLAVAAVFAEEVAEQTADQEGQVQFLSPFAYGYGLHYPYAYAAPAAVRVVKTAPAVPASTVKVIGARVGYPYYPYGYGYNYVY